MRRQNKKNISHQWLVNNEPLVVLGSCKKRDGPIIFHRRDGPLFVTGPPGGTGPPVGAWPPKIKGNWLEMILRKNQTNGKKLALKWFKACEERNNINLNMRKTKMKNFKLKRLLSLAFIGGLTVLNASTVFAAAGDTISNTATLTYDVGGTATVLESSPLGNLLIGVGNGTATNFIEDNLINFTVVTADGASVPVAPSAVGQLLTFDVTNLGNGAQDFSLTAINAAVGVADPFIPANLDAIDPASFAVFVESGATAGYQLAEDTLTYIDELAPLGVARVYIVSTMPAAPLANGSLAVMTLVAQVAAGDPAGVAGTQGADITTDDAGTADVSTTEEDVFNDAAGDLNTAGAADVVKNGQHSDTSSYIVGAAILTVTKTSSTIWDPVNLAVNPKAIVGGYTQYTITVANDAAAGASGDLTSLGDTLPALLALDADFVTNAGPGNPTSAAGASFQIDTTGTGRLVPGLSYCTAAADADGCDGSVAAGGAVTINYATVAAMAIEGVSYTAGELKPGESVVITFNAIVQ